jgi:hypothetical protein
MDPLTDRQIFEGEIATYWFTMIIFWFRFRKALNAQLKI